MGNRSCNEPKDKPIVINAKYKVDEFNRTGLHYNLVAKAVDEERHKYVDPCTRSFMRYIIAMLISFDMGRMMGRVEEAYDFEGTGFGSRLTLKLHKIRPNLEQLMSLSLTEVDLQPYEKDILKAYCELSDAGEEALNQRKPRGKNAHFDVGATKVLHFLNPRLFIIVDSYAAKAFHMAHGVKPGYSHQKYLERMKLAQEDILEYGVSRFQALEPDTPIMRIYDKLTFMTGKKYAT